MPAPETEAPQQEIPSNAGPGTVSPETGFPGAAPAPPAATTPKALLPRRFTATTRRTGSRTYTTRGQLLLPRGYTRAAACSGTVRVTVSTGKRTLSTRTVRLSRSCAFSSRLTFRSPKTLGGVSRLTVKVRYGGNSVLLPRSATTMTVRVPR